MIPGEGTQAKRRAQAVIIDHLTPPLTRAGSYGVMAELERLIDEYYEACKAISAASHCSPRQSSNRPTPPRSTVIAGSSSTDEPAAALRKLDGFLCELKESQIRDGLHVFGRSPEGEGLNSLLLAFARPGRGTAPEDVSLLRALAADLGLREDPLGLDLAEPWTGAHPAALASAQPWRNAGDTVERLEALALRLVAGEVVPDRGLAADPGRSRLDRAALRPAVAGCGEAEISGLLAGLDGRLSSRDLRAPRAAAAPRSCQPAAISIRSIPARCRPKRRGSLVGDPRRCCSSGMRRNTEPTRREWPSQPGAPPICARAAMTWLRHWL